MRLKKGVKLNDFWDAVITCKGSVVFTTNHGDYLNMKSAISQVVFARQFAPCMEEWGGSIECSKEDLEKLADYLEP